MFGQLKRSITMRPPKSLRGMAVILFFPIAVLISDYYDVFPLNQLLQLDTVTRPFLVLIFFNTIYAFFVFIDNPRYFSESGKKKDYIIALTIAYMIFFVVFLYFSR